MAISGLGKKTKAWSIFGHKKRVGKRSVFLGTIAWKTPHSAAEARRKASRTYPQFTVTKVEPEAYAGWWHKEGK